MLYRCHTCRKQFSRDKVMKNTRRVLKNGEDKQNYLCRPCNVLHLRKYNSTSEGKARTYAAVKKSMKKYRMRQNARVYLNEAVKLGKVDKPLFCSKCKSMKSPEGHHEDHSKPFEVVWLCRSCHSDLHRKNR